MNYCAKITLGLLDITSLGQNSIGQMSFSWHVIGQNVRASNVIINEVMGAKLSEGMWANDFQSRHLTN